MIDLTAEQITAAQNNDLTAVTAVIEATEERVLQLARRYATNGAHVDESLAEDLAQEGRLAVWQAIARFEGTDVAQFFTFIDRTVRGTLSNERRAQTRTGVNQQAVKDFETALVAAKGFPYDAERLACSAEVMGARKMSPEMAYAARLAWQGLDSLDRPILGSGGAYDSDRTATVGELIPSEIGIPEELMTTQDVETARQRATRDAVRATLARMGRNQAGVLQRDYGIGSVPYYGDEPARRDDEMAADMGMSVKQVQQARTFGRKRFRVLYLQGANA
jgi:RNA polymerase sigma factor (sigma-70 family)